MTDPEQDEAFEAYLKRRSVLPNALASDDRLEPPAALDAIILKKAREAIKAPAAPDQGKQQMLRAPRWAVPVALAATIMLCLSVVMNISLNTNRPTPNLQQLTAARADGDRRESTPGDIPSREIILPEAVVAGSPVPHAPVVAERRLGPPPGAGAPVPSAPSAASPPPPMPEVSAAAAPKASGSRELKRALTPSDGFAGAAPASPDDGAGARQQAPAYGESSAPAADKTDVAARVATAGDRATTGKSATEGPSAAGAGSMAKGAVPSGNVGSANAAGGSPAAAAGLQRPADPKAWLRQIDGLRAAGKNELADAEMRRFQAAFPGYAAKPLPPASSEPPK